MIYIKRTGGENMTVSLKLENNVKDILETLKSIDSTLKRIEQSKKCELDVSRLPKQTTPIHFD